MLQIVSQGEVSYMQPQQVLERIHRSNERAHVEFGCVEKKHVGEDPDGATGEIVVVLDDFRSVPVGDLVEALRGVLQEFDFEEIRVMFAEGDFSNAMEISFFPGDLVVHQFFVENAVPFAWSDATTMVESSMVRIGGSVRKISIFSEIDPPAWDIEVALNDFGALVGELYSCQGRIVKNLGIEHRRGNVDRYGWVLRSLRDGDLDALVGEVETSWLEFKSHVDLATERGRVEFAQDVARFANAEQSSLLLVGFRTKRKDGCDVVQKVAPLLRSKHSVRRYEDVLDRRVYPPIRGLQVEEILLGGDHCVILVQIPAQRENDKPFLVHGAIVDGRTEGAFFSVVRRRGEGSLPVTAQELHSLIVAGRRALKGR